MNRPIPEAAQIDSSSESLLSIRFVLSVALACAIVLVGYQSGSGRRKPRRKPREAKGHILNIKKSVKK